MPIKKSIMVSDTTLKFIQDRHKDDNFSWTEAINAPIHDLNTLIKLHLPELSENDWLTIIDAYSGFLFQPMMFPLRIASDIMDHYGVVDISKLDSKLQETIKRVHGLSQIEQYAVLDMVRWFWNHSEQFWQQPQNDSNSLIEVIKNISKQVG